MRIDESRRDDQAGGIDPARSRRVGQLSDSTDPAVGDSDVGTEPGGAAAVDNLPAGDHDIEALLRLTPRACHDRADYQRGDGSGYETTHLSHLPVARTALIALVAPVALVGPVDHLTRWRSASAAM